MKVNVLVQCACVESKFVRGIPNYTIQLLKRLNERKTNKYSISFFDFNKERNNRSRIEERFNFITASEIFECNTLNFQTIMKSIREKCTHPYDNKTFSEFIGHKPDVYHLPESAWVPQNMDAPVVVTVHDVMPLLKDFTAPIGENYKIEFKNSLDFALRNGYEIIADSENTKKDILNIFDANEDIIHVVPIGYSDSIYYPEENKEILVSMGIKAPFLLYLGAIDARKGINDIVAAYDVIRKKYGVKLVLAGNIEPAHINALKYALDKGSESGDVIFTGYVSDEQKRVLMSTAEIFLFPSEYEGFGLPVLEAMACGTSVITTNVSSLPEVGGDAVLYVTPKKTQELVEAIEMLLDDSALREECVRKGLKRCREFSWDNTARLTEEVYRIAKEKK